MLPTIEEQPIILDYFGSKIFIIKGTKCKGKNCSNFTIVIPSYSSDLELPGDVWKEVEYNGRIINKLSNTRKKKKKDFQLW